ncbi:MAG TPA: DNA-directed RNA polymerase subunit omega [Candidatus Fimenecus excrementigallinarum]|uniref:DNA-directed RNA polymerase subunit omega n=1 Tax=Candidatus Fimenecus excrementigallinarum TaxID=2840816 RepID=A0A9D1LD19_9FIRM|nr:DNA-directed RNA polymerase subunit omega [Candidatus Fimenecus excrementigallinarum]
MFNPDLKNVLKNNVSRYSLVTATAKLAREISDRALEDGEIMTEKPVSIALDELIAGKYKIVEPTEEQED